ncbi:hypothetical protein C7I36_03395 [Zobellella taiwanensis]|uniref:Type I-E CRISPR-associated protein Cas6/Cse3/CasE n=1 Tax=Zobellella taiwanensis TaxID=347535 RepID=A0A2P7R9T4_9GAMM|nr:type I-E CRISPR-associated protein Cas6/Cse3/CasE [Zobellella taiwanensis]PSJ46959.1 hypothetical protein C7I36_03395 [Zobellella taiwanensis]
MYLSRITLKPDIGVNTQLGQLLLKRTYGTHQLLWDLFDQPKRDFLYREEVSKEQLSHPGAKGEPVYYLLSPHQPKAQTPLFNVQCKPFKPDFAAGQQLSFRLRANPVVTRNKKRHDLAMDEQLTFYRHLCGELHLPQSGKKSELRTRLLQGNYTVQLNDWLCSYLSQTRYFAEVYRCHEVCELLDLAVQEAVSRRLITWLTQSQSREGIFSLTTYQVEDENSGEVRKVPAFEWHGYRAHPLPEKRDKARFLSVDMSGELVIHDSARFLDMLGKGIGPAKGFGCGLMLVKPVAY